MAIDIEKQFETATQIDKAFGQFEAEIEAALSTVKRLRWLKDNLETEIADLKRDAETFRVFDEEQAAAMFNLEPAQLATLRRNYDLPHAKFGKFVRYTTDHLRQICDLLDVSSSGRTVIKKAA